MHLYSRSKSLDSILCIRHFASDTLHPTLWIRHFGPGILDTLEIIFGPDTSRISKLVATCLPFKRVTLAVKGKYVKLREY